MYLCPWSSSLSSPSSSSSKFSWPLQSSASSSPSESDSTSMPFRFVVRPIHLTNEWKSSSSTDGIRESLCIRVSDSISSLSEKKTGPGTFNDLFFLSCLVFAGMGGGDEKLVSRVETGCSGGGTFFLSSFFWGGPVFSGGLIQNFVNVGSTMDTVFC